MIIRQKVIPYKIWDTLSFNSAYQVESEMLHNIPQDMFTASAPTGNSSEGLSKKDFNFYTQIDSQTAELVQPIAKEVTKNAASYNDKILLLQHFLIDGEYRYSLKPGKASDGDQLKHFLTVSKKRLLHLFCFCVLPHAAESRDSRPRSRRFFYAARIGRFKLLSGASKYGARMGGSFFSEYRLGNI
nr:hypothetical protein [Treponema phagedenis]